MVSRVRLLLVVAAVAAALAPSSQALAISDGFRSPTRNIVCVYQGPGGLEPVALICQTLNDGFTVTLRPTGPARVQRNRRMIWMPSLRRLAYNRRWVRQPYSCVVTRHRLSCFSTRSGHAFYLSRSEFSRWRRR